MWNASALTANLPAVDKGAAGVALLREEARLVAGRHAVAVGRARCHAEGRVVAGQDPLGRLQLRHERRRQLHAELRQLLLQRRLGLLALGPADSPGLWRSAPVPLKRPGLVPLVGTNDIVARIADEGPIRDERHSLALARIEKDRIGSGPSFAMERSGRCHPLPGRLAASHPLPSAD